MKNWSLKSLFIIWIIVFLICQAQIYGQDKSNFINFNYILFKLTFTSRINHSNEEINAQLIKEIRERKVDFILKAENEKALKDAGGSDLLLKEILENLPKTVEIEIKHLDAKSKFFADAETLYDRFLVNRKGPEVEKYKIAIEAGEEFIKRYGDEEKIREEYREEFKKGFKEVVEYIQKQLPKLKVILQDQ